jgi:hypothetical protein
MLNWLQGKKTYLVALAAILTAVVAWLNGAIDVVTLVQTIFAALGGAALRAGVAKGAAPAAVLFILAVLGLSGCQTPFGGSGAGPQTGTTAAPISSGQLAQTIGGSQGQAPAQATGGTSAVNFNFASQIPGTLADDIIKLATDQKWTPDQLSGVFRSTNGAPTNVTITTAGNTAQGGNASAIPAAGAGGQAGVSGTVSKP